MDRQEGAPITFVRDDGHTPQKLPVAVDVSYEQMGQSPNKHPRLTQRQKRNNLVNRGRVRWLYLHILKPPIGAGTIRYGLSIIDAAKWRHYTSQRSELTADPWLD